MALAWRVVGRPRAGLGTASDDRGGYVSPFQPSWLRSPMPPALARPAKPGVPSKGIPLGWVELVSGDPDIRLMALMGEDAPTISGGYGGWQEVERPGRVALTNWKGASPLRLALPIVLDGFANAFSVEEEIRDLERMTRRHAGEAAAPILRLGGAVPHGGDEWVIESLEWGASLRRRDGDRTRQVVKVNLMQWVDDTLVVEKPAKRRQRARDRRGTVTVHKGENLREVAKRAKIKDLKRFAKLNDIRDPKKTLHAGRILKRP